MTDLASSDVTVTVLRRWSQGKTRRSSVRITFGDGSLTYPSGGVPLPAFSSFGLKRRLDYLLLSDAGSASGLVWKYDKANHKLTAFEGSGDTVEGALVALDAASDTPAATTLYAEAVGA